MICQLLANVGDISLNYKNGPTEVSQKGPTSKPHMSKNTQQSLHSTPTSIFSGVYGRNVPSLKKFYCQFSDAEQIQNIADSSSLPAMVPLTEIKTVKQLGVGCKNIEKGIVHVEETFVQYSRSCLAQMGLRIWCPNLEEPVDSLLNSDSTMSTITCLNGTLKKPRRVENSIPRRRRRPSKNLVKGYKFSVDQNFPMQYQKIISDIHSHRDDEYSTKHQIYVIKTLPFCSETANNFLHCLDKVMKNTNIAQSEIQIIFPSTSTTLNDTLKRNSVTNNSARSNGRKTLLNMTSPILLRINRTIQKAAMKIEMIVATVGRRLICWTPQARMKKI
ncbi:hypothetical protein VP01_889g9 [Puccinia sorghi]|uniref:Uncharacterized protein n=1 Tax=Puccinia sorghi TaxID=27349 RepID=A0A0L6U846_9BASI|nr:hypothetical protein VP01_889g9 [Puccinia sorghi]